MKREFIFINEGRAVLPMNIMIRQRYTDLFNFRTLPFSEATKIDGLSRHVCWMNMGFYRENPNAGAVIHDYRSLSVGRFAQMKDFIKSKLVSRPNFRVSKPEIEQVMRFRDGVQTCLIDISAPDSIIDVKAQLDQVYGFCYIGVINKERGVDRVIRQFLNEAADHSLIMIGRVEDNIDAEFRDSDRVKFAGLLEQIEVFKAVQSSAISLAYFPNRYPHIHQTPTKLLEYACLGRRILANSQPMNKSISDKYGIECVFRGDDQLFSDLPDLSDWPDNNDISVSPMLFSTHAKNSGLDSLMLSLA